MKKKRKRDARGTLTGAEVKTKSNNKKVKNNSTAGGKIRTVPVSNQLYDTSYSWVSLPYLAVSALGKQRLNLCMVKSTVSIMLDMGTVSLLT